MKPYINYSAILFCSLLILASCSNSNNQSEQKEALAPPVAKQTSDTQPVAKETKDTQPAPAGFTGKVIETMSTAGYTYVQVDTGTEKIWAAAPEFKVEEGETVTVPAGAPMNNYQSKSLNRTFDVVWFVPYIKSGTEDSKISNSELKQSLATGTVPLTETDLSNIKKAESGKTIAEIFAEKTSLENKNVKVRGKVVKFSPQIMGKNWIHIQDGTGSKGTNDLTVTTTNTVKLGDIILVEGTLVLNKDFGAGYKYDVIIEDAQITNN
jgi:hypothetical protein